MESDISSAIAASSVASARSFGSSHSATWSSSISNTVPVARSRSTDSEAESGSAGAAGPRPAGATAQAAQVQTHAKEEEEEQADDDEDDDAEPQDSSSAYATSDSDSEVDLTVGSGPSVASLSSSSSSACTQASRRRQALVHPQRLLPPRPGVLQLQRPAADNSDSDSDGAAAGQQQKYSCCQRKCWSKPQYGVKFVEDVRSVTGDRARDRRCCRCFVERCSCIFFSLYLSLALCSVLSRSQRSTARLEPLGSQGAAVSHRGEDRSGDGPPDGAHHLRAACPRRAYVRRGVPEVLHRCART